MRVILVGLVCMSFAACSRQYHSPTLASIQIHDRNGVSETISMNERVKKFESTDFLTPQPYEKVIRVYKTRDRAGLESKITTYHDNGQIAQYLEAKNSRAHGKYMSWHENGKLHIEAYVIEGIADLNEDAKSSWLFDGLAYVYDERENMVASIPYEMGKLEGRAQYYYPSGSLKREIPYTSDKIHGALIEYDSKGEVLSKSHYQYDVLEGPTYRIESNGACSREGYENGLLMEAQYFDSSGHAIGSISDGYGTRCRFQKGVLQRKSEYRKGILEGKVELFSSNGVMTNSYYLRENLKHGLEEVYSHEGKLTLSIEWVNDEVHGKVKSWYSNGVLQSEKEMSHNKKEGMTLAWYGNGDLMLVEEYNQDELVKGKYYKRGDKVPVSQVLEGRGTATLYDASGHLLKRVKYEKGKIVEE